MSENRLPPSDLELLRREVLSEPPEAALPSRLPDHWLELLARDLDMSIRNSAPTDKTQPSYATAPLAVIIHLLRGKVGDTRLEVSLMQMLKYFRDYEIEIALEMVNRRADLKTDPATLETIFSDRTVTIAAKHLEAFSVRRDAGNA